ncbi:Uncharacterised protein [Yersinia intermedia]|nr:Uncharacterised protein [Yersinia intermedia]
MVPVTPFDLAPSPRRTGAPTLPGDFPFSSGSLNVVVPFPLDHRILLSGSACHSASVMTRPLAWAVAHASGNKALLSSCPSRGAVPSGMCARLSSHQLNNSGKPPAGFASNCCLVTAPFGSVASPTKIREPVNVPPVVSSFPASPSVRS